MTRKIMLLQINWTTNEVLTAFFDGEDAFADAVSELELAEKSDRGKSWARTVMWGPPNGSDQSSDSSESSSVRCSNQ